LVAFGGAGAVPSGFTRRIFPRSESMFCAPVAPTFSYAAVDPSPLLRKSVPSGAKRIVPAVWPPPSAGMLSIRVTSLPASATSRFAGSAVTRVRREIFAPVSFGSLPGSYTYAR
jgi:hypothetical protein